MLKKSPEVKKSQFKQIVKLDSLIPLHFSIEPYAEPWRSSLTSLEVQKQLLRGNSQRAGILLGEVRQVHVGEMNKQHPDGLFRGVQEPEEKKIIVTYCNLLSVISCSF